MLTICRQCRLPKGSRKPVVGPVACYRGAERVVAPIAPPRSRRFRRRAPARNSAVRLLLPAARPACAAGGTGTSQ
ncbi:hypothetical protein FCJ61_34990 [Burkholderia metallica]|nr:hypothetical protein [Burkholderia metallica]